MRTINLKEIPDDLEDVLDLTSFRTIGTEEFDSIMIENEFFEKCEYRSEYRYVMDRATDLGYYRILEIITGLTKKEIQNEWKKEELKNRVKELYSLAEELGYEVTKK